MILVTGATGHFGNATVGGHCKGRHSKKLFNKMKEKFA